MTNYALRSAAIVRRPRRSTLAACTVTALLLVTGCSGNSGGGDKDGDQREVASVSSPSRKNPSQQKESPDGAASGNGRPQIRLDTTEAEKLDMYQPYLSCLKEHGVPVFKAGGDGKPSGNKPAIDPSKLWYPSVDVSKYPAAVKACGEKMPMPPTELDPKTNPDYLENFRAWIRCMGGRGVKVIPAPNNADWSYGEVTVSDSERDRVEEECKMEAFGGRK